MTDVHVRLVTLQNRENCSTVTKCFRTWPYSRAGAAVAVNAALALAAALVLPPLLGPLLAAGQPLVSARLKWALACAAVVAAAARVFLARLADQFVYGAPEAGPCLPQ